ncbi:PXA domain-containing protein [Hyaloraphidium curvatum]|nr:PXA domain-containing protein [Hyaloraphidium curvatum]
MFFVGVALLYAGTQLEPLRIVAELCAALLVAVLVVSVLNWRRAILSGPSNATVARSRELGDSSGKAARDALAALKAWAEPRRRAPAYKADAVRYSSSARLQESIDNLLTLVVRDFVASWYRQISTDASFLSEVERGVQHAVAAGFGHVEGSRVGIQDFAISRVLPLILQHITSFKKAEKRLRGAKLSSAPSAVSVPTARSTGNGGAGDGLSSDSEWEEDGFSRSPARGGLGALGRSNDSLRQSQEALMRSSTDSAEMASSTGLGPDTRLWTAEDAELARHYHQTSRLHPAILPIAASTASLEQKYLRTIVDLLLPDLAPSSVAPSVLASRLIREIVACKVLHPLLEFLSDPDFWNEAIIRLIDFLVADKRLLSTVSEAIRTTSAAASQGSRSEQTDKQRISTFEDLLDAIRNCEDLPEAKLLMKGIVAEMEAKGGVVASLGAAGDKAAKAKAEKMQVYVNRLEVAKRRLERRMVRLGDGDDGQGRDAASGMGQSFSEPAPSLNLFLKDALAVTHFAAFMDRAGRPEILHAYKDIDDLLVAYRSQDLQTRDAASLLAEQRLVDLVRDLFDNYFAPDAPSSLPVSEAVAKDIDRVLAKLPSESALPRANSSGLLSRSSAASVEGLDPLSSAVIEQDRQRRATNLDINLSPFLQAQRELHELMEAHFFADFLRSPSYIEYLSARTRRPSTKGSAASLAPAETSSTALDIRDTWGSALAETDRRISEATQLENDLAERVVNLEDELQEVLGKGWRKSTPQVLYASKSRNRTKEQIKQDIEAARLKKAAAEENVRRLKEERIALLLQQQGVLYVPGYVSTYVRLDGSAPRASLTYDIDVERFDVNGRRLSLWTVNKSYAQFVALHRLLKGRFPTLVSSSQFPVRTVVGELVGKDSVESRRKALDVYLKNLLKSNLICQWGPFLQFLTPDRVLRSLPARSEPSLGSIPSSTVEDDFVVIGGQPGAKPASAPATPVRTPESDSSRTQFDFELVDAEDAPNPGTPAIAFQFLVELFDLHTRSNYWRRQAVTVLMNQFGAGIVKRRVAEILEQLASETSLLSYLSLARDTFWPGGRFASDRPVRTEEERRRSEAEAARRLRTLIPDLFGALVGRENARAGAERVHALFQNRRLNQELAYRLLDLSISTFLSVRPPHD